VFINVRRHWPVGWGMANLAPGLLRCDHAVLVLDSKRSSGSCSGSFQLLHSLLELAIAIVQIANVIFQKFDLLLELFNGCCLLQNNLDELLRLCLQPFECFAQLTLIAHHDQLSSTFSKSTISN